MRDWEMIETGSGQVAWAPKDQLESKTMYVSGATAFRCQESADTRDCKRKVLEANHSANFLGADAEGGLQFLPLAQSKKNGPITSSKPLDFRLFNAMCFHPQNHFQSNSGRTIKSTVAKAYATKLESLKTNLTSSLGLSDWNDPKNPYLTKDQSLTNIIAQLKSCSSTCDVNAASLDKLANLDVNKTKSLSGSALLVTTIAGITVTNNTPGRKKLMDRALRSAESSTNKLASLNAVIERYFGKLWMGDLSKVAA